MGVFGIRKKSRESRLSNSGDPAFVSSLSPTTVFLPDYGIPESTWIGISYPVACRSYAINSKWLKYLSSLKNITTFKEFYQVLYVRKVYKSHLMIQIYGVPLKMMWKNFILVGINQETKEQRKKVQNSWKGQFWNQKNR